VLEHEQPKPFVEANRRLALLLLSLALGLRFLLDALGALLRGLLLLGLTA
jgi:hypothetical protein